MPADESGLVESTTGFGSDEKVFPTRLQQLGTQDSRRAGAFGAFGGGGGGGDGDKSFLESLDTNSPPWAGQHPSTIGAIAGGLLSDADFTDRILDTMQQFQTHSSGHLHPGIASSMQDILATLADYSSSVPNNFAMNTRTLALGDRDDDNDDDDDDDCFHTPGKLNKFLSHVQSIIFHHEREEEEEDNTGLEMTHTSAAADGGGGTSREVGLVDDEEAGPTAMDDMGMRDDTKSDEVMKRRRKRMTSNPATIFDLADAMDEMDTDDIKCLKNFMPSREQDEMCSYFSRTFSDVFAKLYASGFQCHQVLFQQDMDDDDGLDLQHQLVLASQFQTQTHDQWSDVQVKRLMKLAPNALGEDFLDVLPDNLFKNNLRDIGRLAAGKGSNPSLREAFRDRLENLGMETLSQEGIRQLGPGLLALSRDQLLGLDGALFIDAEIDRFLDDDYFTDGKEDQDVQEDNDDDDDDEEEDGFFLRYTIGQQIKNAANSTVFKNSQLIARTLPLLNHDLDFIRRLDSEALFDALPQLQTIHFDHEEAIEMLEKLRENSDIQSNRGNLLRKLGHLAKGLHPYEIEDFEKKDLEDAVPDIKDIDFDDEQAEAIMDELLDEIEILTFGNIANLGKLAKGLSVHHIQTLGSQDLGQVVGMKGLHFNQVKQNLIAEKLRDEGFAVKSIMSLHETFSDEDLEDLFEDDRSKFIALSSHIKWQPTQAVTVANLVKRYLGDDNRPLTKLSAMRNAAIGLLPSDIDDMAATPDDALDLFEMLDDAHEDLNSAQIDKLIEKLEDMYELDSDSSDSDTSDATTRTRTFVGQQEALQGATIMAYLDDDDFSNLEFDSQGKAAFLGQVYKMTTKKMSRSHLENLANHVYSMAGSDQTTPYSRLRALGQTALGLTPKQLEDIGGKAIIDNLDILRNLPFSKAQAKAILSAIDEDQPDWTCRSDILARLGPLLQHADQDDFDELCMDALLASLTAVMKGLDRHREAVEERLEEGFDREGGGAIDEDGIDRLVARMIQAYNAPPRGGRQRRALRQREASDTLSCSLVQQLRGSAHKIPQDYLKRFPPAQIRTCLADIGAISDWKPSAVEIIIQGLKSAEGKPSQWREETVRRAGSLISGLSPVEIQQMHISGVDTLNSIGKHNRLSRDQLKAGVDRWMSLTKKSGAREITEGELASLSEFVCGLEPTEITQLSDAALKRSLKVIGLSTSCSQEQKAAFVNKIISIYGDNTKLWKPVTVAEIGHLLGHLERDRLQTLTSDQLSLVSPSVIQRLPVQAVAALRKPQLQSLGTNQINALTDEQFYSLSPAQQLVVAPKASVAFHHQDNGANTSQSVGMLTAASLAMLARLLSA